MGLKDIIPAPYRVLLVVALIAATWGHGYMSGIEREGDRRDALELKQTRIAGEAFDNALRKGAKASRELVQARSDLRAVNRKLEEKERNAKESDLAVANCPQPQASGGSAERDPGAPACFVTDYYVGLWNDAWKAGVAESVPRDPGRPPFRLFSPDPAPAAAAGGDGG